MSNTLSDAMVLIRASTEKRTAYLVRSRNRHNTLSVRTAIAVANQVKKAIPYLTTFEEAYETWNLLPRHPRANEVGLALIEKWATLCTSPAQAETVFYKMDRVAVFEEPDPVLDKWDELILFIPRCLHRGSPIRRVSENRWFSDKTECAKHS